MFGNGLYEPISTGVCFEEEKGTSASVTRARSRCRPVNYFEIPFEIRRALFEFQPHFSKNFTILIIGVKK